jgi:Heparinase II/III-like protein/Heparinase II/III N-terminus
MLTRVRNVLARLRKVDAPAAYAASPEAWPSFDDEVAESGGSTLEWVGRRRACRSLYVDIDDAAVARAAARHPNLAAATIASADRVLRHEFNLLGSGPFIPRDPERASETGYQAIDWRLDPIRRVRFPGGFPHRSWNPDTMRPANGDIKLPWELGRCQCFFALGEAFRLTSREAYAREIIDQIADFTAGNPVSDGIQWVCTMDVGLRAVSWAIGLALAARSSSVSDDQWVAAYTSLFDHGLFIERNLENTYEVTSNHFLSNVLGLHFLGDVFGDLPSGGRWRRAAREWLEQEMGAQVLADGADYESSIAYHRLVAELFLGGARLAASQGEPLSRAYLDRLRTMIEYLAAVLRPDGLMPVVGDADDGRLHIASGYGDANPQDPRHLLAGAAAFFGRDEWTIAAGPGAGWEAAWWGLESPAEAARPSSSTRRGVQHFPDAGATILRNEASYLLVTNGRVGTNGFGNHKHNDQLSFEYHVGGAAVVVDPGSYVYTPDPDARNMFRSTAYHNTLSVDGVEQNELRPKWLFRLFEQAHPEHLHVGDGPLLEYIGRHTGYRRLPQPVIHTRRFGLDASSLIVEDVLDGGGRHALRWHFHFDPAVEISSGADAGTFVIRAADAVMTLAPPPELAAQMTLGWYSPSYGVRQQCRALDFAADVDLDVRRAFTFRFARQ